jgi:hypothetical protein
VAKYPARLPAGSDAAPAFERRADLYSVRSAGRAGTAGAVAILSDDAATFAVFEGRPPRRSDPEATGPVYAAGPGGPLAVPTGRVFVRLAEGLRPEDRRAAFARAGFAIERTLSYAPQAAWLRPARGGVASALPGVRALQRIAGVVHVEPQLLMTRAERLDGKR